MADRTWKREEAMHAAEEAVAQGWAPEVNAEGYDSDAGTVRVFGGPYTDGRPGEWWVVELRMAHAYHDEVYWLRQRDEWRRLKAKTDEIKQIIAEAGERGWRVDSFGQRMVKKHGRLGMYVEVYPPGYSPPYPARVGGMRTWRKLCREADGIIDAPAGALETGEG
jgi:hypothetical protein